MERTWQDRIAASEWMSDKDKALFQRFAEDANLHQIGERRIEKYRTDCCIAHEMSKRNLLGMVGSMTNLKEAVSAINSNQTYGFESKRDAKRTLGSIYSFLHFKDRSLKYAPKEIKQLVAHLAKASDKRLARAIITRPEMREMLQYANLEDKALISLIFETGMRIGEFNQLRRSNIRQIEEGLEVSVPAGKTGERMVVVVEATKFVNAWLDSMPNKDKDAPLWPKQAHSDKPMSGPAIAKHIRLVAARLNEARKKKHIPPMEKSVNPHNFRHSRASELGGEPGMSEQILCKYFGWEIGSDMPKTYLHLTNDQVKRAVLRTYGRAKNEEPEAIVTARTCPKCKEENPIAMNFCGRCGYDLVGKKTPSRFAELEAIVEAQGERLKKLEGSKKTMAPQAARGTVEEAKGEAKKRPRGA